jgi:hypothetical protein
MHVIFKCTLCNLQEHIFVLRGHKVCARTRYFNARGRSYLKYHIDTTG